MKEILGYCLLAIPFLAVFVLIVLTSGWRAVFIIAGGSGILLGCVFGGIYLIQGS